MRLTKRELQPVSAPVLEIKEGHCLEYIEAIPFHPEFRQLYIDWLAPKIYKALLLDTELKYRMVTYGNDVGVISLIAVNNGHSLVFTVAIEKSDVKEQGTGLSTEIIDKFLSLPNTHIAIKSLLKDIVGEFVFSEADISASEESDGSIYLVIPINNTYELQLNLNNVAVQLDETIRETDSSDRGA